MKTSRMLSCASREHTPSFAGCLGRHSHLLHHRPEEADQLTGDGDHGDLWPLPIRQMIEPLMQPVLCLPGVGDDGRRLPGLPSLQIHACRGSMAIAPCCLHEHVTTVTVAR